MKRLVYNVKKVASKSFPRGNSQREYSFLEASKTLNVVYDVVLRYIRDNKLPARKVPTKGLLNECRSMEKDLETFKEGIRRR